MPYAVQNMTEKQVTYWTLFYTDLFLSWVNHVKAVLYKFLVFLFSFDSLCGLPYALDFALIWVAFIVHSMCFQKKILVPDTNLRMNCGDTENVPYQPTRWHSASLFSWEICRNCTVWPSKWPLFDKNNKIPSWTIIKILPQVWHAMDRLILVLYGMFVD